MGRLVFETLSLMLLAAVLRESESRRFSVAEQKELGNVTG